MSTNLIPINFNDIYTAFLHLQPQISISYLTKEELNKMTNFPIKETHFNQEDLTELYNNYQICLIIIAPMVRQSNLLKEAMQHNFINILDKIPNLNFDQFYKVNKKMSAITAGLGQYGKNQLVYTKKFGFHHNIWTFGIRNCVTNLPTRNIPNYYYADICNNCNECIKNCPAHAIHGDQYPGWLDRLRCIQFYHYGEHPYIPSIKYEINKFLNYPHSEEELKQVHDLEDFKNLFGFTLEGETGVKIDNQPFVKTKHYCSECMNQIPCRKVELTYND